MKENAESTGTRGATKWIYFGIGCAAALALIYLVVERDKEGLGEAVYHTTGAMLTCFGIFTAMFYLERRRRNYEKRK